MMYLNVPLRLAVPLQKNADGKYEHTHGTIVSKLFLHTIESSSEMERLFSMGIMPHRLADLEPMSLNSQCILVHYIWLVSSRFDRRPNDTHTLDRLTWCYNYPLYKTPLSCRTAYLFDWKSRRLQEKERRRKNRHTHKHTNIWLVSRYIVLELRWCGKCLLFTATHSLRSSPSGKATAFRRLPEPNVAAACFIRSYWCVPSGIFFFGLNVLLDRLNFRNERNKNTHF